MTDNKALTTYETIMKNRENTSYDSNAVFYRTMEKRLTQLKYLSPIKAPNQV